MNYTELLRQCVAYFSFAVASIFVLSLVGFLLRRQLRVLLDRWRALGRLGQCVTLVFVSGFVLYGGSKNMAQQRQHQDSDAQHEPLFSQESLESLFRSLERSESESEPSSPLHLYTANPTFNSQLSTISRWAARGAWVDWQRIEFPDGFAFPIGTNQITEVTLMSYGALIPASSFPLWASRSDPSFQSPTTDIQTLQHSNILTLPCRVSLEPGESSIHYGLTPSNSFLIAWENVCVERSATNRVDASIELFRNGDTLVTVQPLSQPSLPSHPITIFTPAVLPEGWVGEGQDAAWATNAFPEFAENIRTNGYENWLADYIGVNEQNGRYQVKVSVMTLPDGPCYLVCGPYRTVITAPGVYCFPLEVFEEYTVRTYPEAVPLTFEYDDGFRFGDEDDVMMGASFASVPRPGLQSATAGGEGNVYTITQFPQVYIHPNAIPLDQAVGTSLRVLCNAANITYRDYSSLWGQVILNFTGPSEAVIEFADIQTEVMLNFGVGGGRVCSGLFTIIEPWHHPSTNECDNVWTNDFGVIGGTNGTSSAGN